MQHGGKNAVELIEDILPTIYTFQKDDREKTEEVAICGYSGFVSQ